MEVISFRDVSTIHLKVVECVQRGYERPGIVLLDASMRLVGMYSERKYQNTCVILLLSERSVLLS